MTLAAYVDELIALCRDDDVPRALTRAHQAAEESALAHHLGLSVIASCQSDPEACMRGAQAAFAQAPEEPVVLQQLAIAQVMNGQPLEAERSARQAVNRDDSPRSKLGLAKLLSVIGKLPEAERVYRGLLAVEPDNAEALLGLAMTRRRRGDQATALHYYAQAWSRRPTDVTPLRELIRMYAEAGWAVGATALARATRQGHHPDEVKAALDMIRLMIDAQVSLRSPEKALVDASRESVDGLVEASASLNAAVQLHSARMVFDTGRHDATRAILARLDPETLSPSERADYHYVHALLAQSADATDDAIDGYQRALQANPEHWEAATNLTTLLMRKGDEASMNLAGQALMAISADLTAHRPQLLFNEALFLRRIGHLQESATRFERLVQMLGAEKGLGAEAQRQLAQLHAGES